MPFSRSEGTLTQTSIKEVWAHKQITIIEQICPVLQSLFALFAQYIIHLPFKMKCIPQAVLLPLCHLQYREELAHLHEALEGEQVYVQSLLSEMCIFINCCV